ncbi:YheV family putative zinc ribbon protein [Paraferrimonas haliotis]|uniref:DNA-binding protein n=1 Tax=Paraferrimonas haliotis TaxID=2013866 RepID=A0AA37TKV7_9GAMM|nr:YheV family putative zinc ribbon protein [Paraferrimonas haliotis]GLS83347.1 DNA-binding protein [Paraferrimonas haliotis]
MSKRKKRFIAGAVCPKCQAKDSIMLFILEGIETIECADCGHTQQQLESEQQSKSGDMIGLFKPE